MVKTQEEMSNDLSEIYNNLIDDLGVPKDEALEIYKINDVNKARVMAIKKYTLKVLKKKMKKYR